MRGYLAADLIPPRVAVAGAPSDAADWALAAAGEDPEAKGSAQPYHLTLPATGQALTIDGGQLATGAEPADLAFHHVPDDDPADGDLNGSACASWPEIATNTSGPPAPPAADPGGEVEGFFEAHVHGMAFEFLGGELRCGRPWHPYGVEYALGDCYEEGNAFNARLEVAVAGQRPGDPVTEYDPVGWPSWPVSRPSLVAIR